MSDNLGRQSRLGLLWTLTGTVSRTLATMVISIVLARLLGPEEFGVIGIALVFVALTQVFIDVGLTAGVIQQKEISDEELSTVFWLNVSISIAFSLLIFLIAPLVGNFYESEQVYQVLRYLSLVPVIAGLGKVHSSILTRHLDFKSLSIRDVGATIAGGALGIVAAYQDWGVYALVVQQLTSAVIGTGLLWIGTGWLPKRVFSFASIKPLLSFSSFVFFDSLLQSLFRRMDTLFVGKVFSPVTLGFYSRAESLKVQINNLSTNSIGKVLFPVFSKVQDDVVRFREIFRKSLSAMLVATTALSLVLFINAELIVIGLLGEEWYPTVVLFQILMFNTISLPARSIMVRTMLAKGLSKLKFKLGIIDKILKLSIFPIGYYYGIEAFAWAVVLVRMLAVFINYYFVRQYLALTWRDIAVLLLPVLLLVVLLLVFVYLVPPTWSIAYTFGAGLVYILGLLLARSPGLLLFIHEFRSLIDRKLYH